MQKVKSTTNEYLSDDAKKCIVNRLSRIEGHIRAVKRMVNERRCCDEILIQMAAVGAALRSITIKLVEEEMLDCLTSCGQLDAEERMTQAMKAVTSMLKHG